MHVFIQEKILRLFITLREDILHHQGYSPSETKVWRSLSFGSTHNYMIHTLDRGMQKHYNNKTNTPLFYHSKEFARLEEKQMNLNSQSILWTCAALSTFYLVAKTPHPTITLWLLRSS